MNRLQVDESRPRKVSAWLIGKFTELKLRVDDSSHGPLRLLESLEVLGLGIYGKLALWRALGAAADSSPVLRGFDYERLTQRAEEQRWRVEVVRLEAAKAAFRHTFNITCSPCSPEFKTGRSIRASLSRTACAWKMRPRDTKSSSTNRMSA
jgi:hypothetical protein